MITFERIVSGGRRRFYVYTKEEADEVGIEYIYWRDASVSSEWLLCDDDYVVELLRFNERGNILRTSVGSIYKDDVKFYGSKIMKSPGILQSYRLAVTGRSFDDKHIAEEFVKEFSSGKHTLLEALRIVDNRNGINYKSNRPYFGYVRLSAVMTHPGIYKSVTSALVKEFKQQYSAATKELSKMAKKVVSNEAMTKQYVLEQLRNLADSTEDDRVRLGALKEIAKLVEVDNGGRLGGVDDIFGDSDESLL